MAESVYDKLLQGRSAAPRRWIIAGAWLSGRYPDNEFACHQTQLGAVLAGAPAGPLSVLPSLFLKPPEVYQTPFPPETEA